MAAVALSNALFESPLCVALLTFRCDRWQMRKAAADAPQQLTLERPSEQPLWAARSVVPGVARGHDAFSCLQANGTRAHSLPLRMCFLRRICCSQRFRNSSCWCRNTRRFTLETTATATATWIRCLASTPALAHQWAVDSVGSVASASTLEGI